MRTIFDVRPAVCPAFIRDYKAVLQTRWSRAAPAGTDAGARALHTEPRNSVITAVGTTTDALIQVIRQSMFGHSGIVSWCTLNLSYKSAISPSCIQVSHGNVSKKTKVFVW
jgi:hypothetical protein